MVKRCGRREAERGRLLPQQGPRALRSRLHSLTQRTVGARLQQCARQGDLGDTEPHRPESGWEEKTQMPV